MGARSNQIDARTAIQGVASAIAFGRPILVNVLRAIVVEVIVGRGLGERWTHCSADYYAWDFEHQSGLKLEVKQSAARQSWAKPGDLPSAARFDIRERTGRYDGAEWIAGQKRWADVYVFGHHPRVDEDADHRDPAQWDFYVVSTDLLPNQNTIALTRIKKLSRRYGFAELQSAADAFMRTNVPSS